MFLPSTVDWCESNYLISDYIAEYWNTITGVCFMISGYMFYYNNQTWFYTTKYAINFTRIIVLFLLVGIGTILFHSTLLYPFQLLDEIPMILLSNEYLLLLMSLQTFEKIFHKNIKLRLEKMLFLTYKMINIIVFIYFIHPKLQIITFHITLKISEISILYILINLLNRLNYVVYSQIYKNQDFIKRQTMMTSLYNRSQFSYLKESNLLLMAQKKIKRYIDLRSKMKTHIYNGIYVYGTSMIIWCFDNFFCKYVEPLQLHAMWHILSSLGIYFLNNIVKIQSEIDEMIFDD
jgi:dihydroceramidase